MRTSCVTYTHVRQALLCPECGRAIVRVPRSTADRLQSLLTPVWRFSCSDAGCSWTDTIRRDELRIPLFS